MLDMPDIASSTDPDISGTYTGPIMDTLRPYILSANRSADLL